MRPRTGYTTPLVIAIMAFAVVAFLFLIDTAVNPDGSRESAQSTTNTRSQGPDTTFLTNENIVIRNVNFLPTNTNSAPDTNTNEPFPTVIENPIWDVKEITSALFATPYNQGDISHLNCNDQYCLVASSSAGWVYHVLRYEQDSFSEIYSYTGTDTDRPYDPRSAWNGTYWLMTSGTALLRYDGTTASKIFIPDSTCTIKDVAWNGSYWLMATLCNAANPYGKLIKYDGTTFTTISTEYPGITHLAWNGNEWALIGPYNNASTPLVEKMFFLTYDSKTFTDYSEKFVSLRNEEMSAIIWKNDEWQIAMRHQATDGESPLLYHFSGQYPSGSPDGFFKDVNGNIGFLLAKNIYAIGGLKQAMLLVERNGTLHNLSSAITASIDSLAEQDANTLLIGTTNGKILRMTFIHE